MISTTAWIGLALAVPVLFGLVVFSASRSAGRGGGFAYRRAGMTRTLNTPRERALFSIGNVVSVAEYLDRPDMNWDGTILGMHAGNVLIRDTEYPFAVMELPKSVVFPQGTTFSDPLIEWIENHGNV